MFSVRVITPAVTDEEGRHHAGAELRIGAERFPFLVELRHWHISDYERQWRDGIARLFHGARSTALVTAYRGIGEGIHHMWGLWRDDDHVYVQQHAVVVAELDGSFDPRSPYEHLGERIATSYHELPIPEWRLDLVHVYAAAMGIRWPLLSR